MKTLLLSALFALSTLAASASTTTITAAHLQQDLSGTPLASGYFCVTPVNQQGQPIGIENNGQVLPKQACFPVTAGVVAASVPDTGTITPSGVGYAFQVQDVNHIPLFNGPQSIYPTGSTWSLDSWVPTTSINLTSAGLQHGNAVPQQRCGTQPALFYTASQLYSCVNQIWVAITGSGGLGTLSGSTSIALSANGTFVAGDAIVADSQNNAIDAGAAPILSTGGVLSGPLMLPGTTPTGQDAASAAWVLSQLANLPSSSSVVYPPSGIPVSTGSAWGTSITNSAGLASALSDETGSGPVVFAYSPTFVNPALSTPSALVLTHATGLPTALVTADILALTGCSTPGYVYTPQGNNCVAAATGSGSMVYPAAGIALSTGSAWSTPITAPAGAIVGTTDTQTLTNKSIAGSEVNSGSVPAAQLGNVVTAIGSNVYDAYGAAAGVQAASLPKDIYPVGTGGVTANTSVSFNSSGAAIASTGGFGGIATSTVASGGSVYVQRTGLGTMIFDAASTVGDYVFPSTTTLGYAHDSGIAAGSVNLNTIPATTSIIGVVESAASGSGSTGTVRLHGPGSVGAASLAANLVGPSLPNTVTSAPGLTTAAGGTLGTAAYTPSSAYDPSGAASAAQSAAIAASDPAGSATTAQGNSLQKSANLSDLASPITARTNLGLGSAALASTSAFDAKGAAGLTAVTVTIAASNSPNAASANVQCTGTNDDVCINNALTTYCPSAVGTNTVPGCHVILEPGIYSIAAPVTINNDDVWLDGQSSCMWGGYTRSWTSTSQPAGAIGQGCSQLQAATSGYNLLQITGGDSKGSDTSRHRGITISHLYLLGYNYSSIGIYAPNGDDNVHISDNIIQHTAIGMSVLLDSPVISGNSIQDISGDAIDLLPSAGAAAGVYARVVQNLIFDIGGTGVTSQSLDAIISENIIGDTFVNGVVINTYGNDNKVEDNSFSGNTQSAVYAANVRTPIIVANSFDEWSTNVGYNTSAHQTLNASTISIASSAAYAIIADNNIDTAFNMTVAAIGVLGANATVTGNSIHGVWNNGGNPIYLSNTSSGAGNANSGNTTWNHNGDTVQQQGTFQQIIAGGSAPTIALGASAGTSANSAAVTITGTNMAGVVTVTTASTGTAASGTLATITFNGTLSTAPVGCTLFPRTANAAGILSNTFTTAPSTTTWTVAAGPTVPAVSTAYSFSYICE